MNDIVTFPSHWPEKVGDGSTLSTAATDLAKPGKTIRTAVEGAGKTWGRLEGNLDFADCGKVKTAITDSVVPYADLVQSSISDLEKAFGTLAGHLETFKPKWTDLKKEVSTYNNLKSQPSDEDDREDGVDYRTPGKTADLQRRVNNAADEYKSYIDDCVKAIDKADPSSDPTWAGSDANAFIAGAKKHWTEGRKAIQAMAAFRSVDGKVGFRWSMTNPAPKNLSQYLNGKVPWWMPEEARKRWLDKFPEGKSGVSYGTGSLVDKLKLRGYFNNADPNMDSFKGTIAADGQKLSLYYGAAGTKMPGWADKASKKLHAFDHKLTKGLESLGKNKWVKGGGAALAVLDTVSTYKSSYANAYNETMREHPDWSEDKIKKEAVTSAAIEGTGENVGKVAGGMAGRAVGAAAGAALIPVIGGPIGGFVGGIIGEKVGGFIGKEVGSFINDWRQEGFGGAVDNVKDKAVDTVKNIGSALNPFD